jgi:hypothetical protein
MTKSSRGGIRKDLGIYVRSSWEANYARYLNFLKKSGAILRWEFEPTEFEFTSIKRGTRFYLPDFAVWEHETEDPTYYVEVKGYMDRVSKTKLKRMAKYYPEVKIKVVGKKEYNSIAKWKNVIDGWE